MDTKEVINSFINIFHENKLAHAYLVETNNLNKALEDVKVIIKNIICNDNYSDECSKCNLCHLIDTDSLPSLLIVYPDGKAIKKDQIEIIKAKFSTKSVYTNYSIYVIMEPELMNETAYNKMLKFIEEPEDNIIGFFISSNKEKIADTIVSRLENVKLIYDNNSYYSNNTLDEQTINKIDGIMQDYISKLLKYDELLCYNINVIQKELTDKAELVYFFQQLLAFFKSQLINNYEKSHVNLCNLVIKYLDRLNYNVNIPLLLDSFVIEMEQAYEK